MTNPAYVTDGVDEMLASQYNDALDFARRNMLDYKLVVTISSGNITIAIKHADGTDPSTDDPLIFKIKNDYRTLSAALSVTLNAGANSFAAGSSELATKEVDYFVYLGWRAASSEIIIGFSRIPFARRYVDFSSTATNQKYGVFSTTPATTDDVIVIGRIAATLSAGAGYTWTSTSQSAPTTDNTVNRPIYDTRVLDYGTAVTYAGGTTDPTSLTISTQSYYVNHRNMIVNVIGALVRGGGNRTTTRFSMPWTPSLVTPANGLDSVTAAGLSSPTASYINGINFVFVETMANDGTYYANANFILL